MDFDNAQDDLFETKQDTVAANTRNPLDEKVLFVLRNATQPLGPTEIARRIGEPWCIGDGDYPQSSAINPILKRIKAVRLGSGQYKMPKGEDSKNE